MRKSVLIIMVVALSLAAGRLGAQTKAPAGRVDWQSKVCDFGSIARNKPATAVFEFTNNSGKPVLVSDVVTSCGCTRGDYPRDPVAPGAKATVSVIYNAASTGNFNKTATVNFSENAEPAVLLIKGTVVE